MQCMPGQQAHSSPEDRSSSNDRQAVILRNHDESLMQKMLSLNPPMQRGLADHSPTGRKVSFDRSVLVRAVLHRNDFKEEDFKAMWYTPEETNSTYLEAKHLVKKLTKGSQMDDQELAAVRGLECRTRRATARKMEIRNLAVTAVREEQARQRQKGFKDPEYLAVVYSAVSTKAQIEAMRRGRLDQLAALV